MPFDNSLLSVTVKGQEVVIDTALLEFNESNLSVYMESEGAYYDYFGRQLAEAEHALQIAELDAEILYSEAYSRFKDSGCTEKQAEAAAKRERAVADARREALDRKRDAKLIAQHLKAWDKSHENAQSRGHTLRREMDRLNV